MTGRAGKLDTRVKFERETEISTGGGGTSKTWTEQFSRWGGVSHPKLSARLERENAGALTSVQRASILVRADPDTITIKPSWRCRFDNKVWNIRGITPIGRNDRLSIIVESGVAA